MRSSRRTGRTVTQRDVAERAGVSVRTVSNVVNDFVYVSDDVRARVRRALEELDYRPNLVARSLSRGRSGLIALGLPLDVAYFSELASLLVAELERRSLVGLIDKTDGRADRERELVLRSDNSNFFDGVIISPVGLDEAELRRRASRKPMVLLGEKMLGGPFDHVAIDDRAAARAATEHLIALGRRRIAVIGNVPQGKGRTARHRMEGYRSAMRAAQRTYDRSLVMPVPRFRRENGAASMQILLDRDDPPDAVFCFNDLLALGALRTILERGLRVPEDVALIGFDDIEDSRYSLPALSTVSPDKARIAERAVDLVVRRLSGDTSPAGMIEAPWTLVGRESTLGRGTPPQISARSPI
ncbi:MAG TPA: LacI family DNA-binding transcriptional regulator [Mycobacteriales bacterium]|nr:LacI family DNA-binding transcriptional regulator [Mycobacteriales bacterium]